MNQTIRTWCIFLICVNNSDNWKCSAYNYKNMYSRMNSLVHSNEQRWNEQRYLSICFTSYLLRLADESTLRVYSLRLLLLFKTKHSIKFRATWLSILGNMTLVLGDITSGEMTFGWLDRLPYTLISSRRTSWIFWLSLTLLQMVRSDPSELNDQFEEH